MITASFKKKQGQYQSVKVSGHALYANAGYDIVCAAVTACTDMLELSLNDVFNESIKSSVDQKNAVVEIALQKSSENAQKLFIAYNKELKNIQEQFPENLKILEVE